MTINPDIRAYAVEQPAATEPTDEQVIAYVRKYGPVRLNQICQAFGATEQAARLAQQLQRLRRRGQLRPVGAVLRSKGQKWIVRDR